ncbi:cell division protein FtsB [Spirosoma montaniterrae]|uniref:Cell division protein FtsB n=2 Tax=Spirosoma montaniterrae TaxID=1178516 RepID=A0A1P9X4K4_9BACT|nr:cell division protein FtsB [Spirosoma montaniterrae]
MLVGFVLLFVAAYALPLLFPLAKLAFFVFLSAIVIDAWLLFRPGNVRDKLPFFARRDVPDRLSNGDNNPLTIYLENRYNFQVDVEVVDEIPFQFQRRDLLFRARLNTRETQTIRYELRPTRRGEYSFGAVNVFVLTPLGLLKRRFQFGQGKIVAVYPSFLQMRQYELLAATNRLNEVGVKRIRRLGHSMEFEQVRPYTTGDDVRTINWKATARRSDPRGTSLQINAYQDERSQPVYCLIDKGRVMRSPFEGLTLLDYAINASLVLSNIALLKQDRAGILTFSDHVGQLLPADRRSGQMLKIMNVLYRQKTRFLETDYESLYANVRTHIRQRSLLLLFTNFETVSGMQRQLPYLRRLAKDHLLLVIFFENTELRALLDQPARDTETIYLKTIGEKFAYEKKQIVKELAQYGIQTILTAPQNLTANTVNKYLELKARGLI